MESKAPRASFNRFKEVRVGFDCTTGPIVHIQLPSTSALRSSRVVRKVVDALPPSKTEEEFKKRHLATSSNLFFRSTKRYPRCILWRCLESNTVLELRPLDLSKDKHDARDASLTVRLGFPTAIRPTCVDLAESAGSDVFSLFVLTKNNDLYTFTIRANFLCDLSATEQDLAQWCKVSRPASLAISHTHRIQAQNHEVLICSLGDGRLLKLTRKSGNDGDAWEEVAYNDSRWGASLLGMIRWSGSNTVRYEGYSLDQHTALSTVVSPDGKHIFAVTLNHTLRAWNLAEGKQTLSRDLLDIEREPTEVSTLMLDPGLSNVLWISHDLRPVVSGDSYYVVTFSPHQSGTFTIWAVRDAEEADGGIRVLFESDILSVPDPDDGAHWSMSDFRITGHKDDDIVDFWILLRLNKRWKLYQKTFSSLGELGNEWYSDWNTTTIDGAKSEPVNQTPQKSSGSHAEGVEKAWVNFIFTPGRVREDALETALELYVQSDLKGSVKGTRGSLRERIISCVASVVQHPPLSGGEASVSKAQDDVNSKWLSFWNIISDLNQAGSEPLSFALDTGLGMPWIVLSDACSAIRRCTKIEVVAYNKSRDLLAMNGDTVHESIEIDENDGSSNMPSELAVLIEAAAMFRASFSTALRLACIKNLKSELWQDSTLSVPVRIQAFYDQAGFESEVGDGQFNELATLLAKIGGFSGLSTEAFYSILRTLPGRLSKQSALVSTAFGRKVLTRGAQDVIALRTRVLSDLLYLIVLISEEIDPEEHSMDNLDPVKVYAAILEQLRICSLLQWLATNSITRHVNDSGKKAEILKASVQHISSVLEVFYAGDLQPQPYDGREQGLALSNDIADLLTWAVGDTVVTVEKVVVTIQCHLLVIGNIDLATSFLYFQPSTAWGTYIRGRLYLQRHEHVEAALCFKKAAFKLSRPQPPSSFYSKASESLIDPVTASFLASGLVDYYRHVLDLFSVPRAHTQISQFARLALQHCTSSTASSERSDILVQLFQSSVALADFDAAYVALEQYTDHALQKASLATLVTDMVNAGCVEELIDIPLLNLKSEVDEILRGNYQAETISGTPNVKWFKILYAWHVHHGDYRGAASALIEHASARQSRKGPKSSTAGAEMLDEYVVAINALATTSGTIGEDEGYILLARKGGKRELKRLQDIRRDYNEELDRREAWERGSFAIYGGDEDDEMEG